MHVCAGGVWKNTEDEILKAAIMKYGKNQWARISSLLVRKSAKQCKARWYEWLDPSIKKTEWTRAEEEKLLHLAKIMPCQWRTIAPIIGRTAAQCLEHYEKLLDAAQAADGGDYDPNDDPRRLRPGEIDPNPESKPARYDPVDMDEDEKEMLSEARARLANTKGKKAKRKAREKQLEEARRLALLQKTRELKAAGINTKRKARRFTNSLDYNNEIPFQKLTPAGYYDTSEERVAGSRQKEDQSKFLGKSVRELEGKRRDREEEAERKKDSKRLKLFKKTNLPDAISAVNKLNDPALIKARGVMSLPTPQMTDGELEELSKVGSASALVAAGSGATGTLLGQYGQTPAQRTPQRTPMRTPMGRDTVLEETQNLIALTKSQTPLLGDENAVLHKTDMRGMTPRGHGVATPNVMGTPREGMTPTPRRRLTTPATPARDNLGINEAQAGMSAADAIMANRSRREQKRQEVLLKNKLRAGFDALPEAENEYMFKMPELPAEIEVQDEEPMVEDAEDAMSRVAAEVRAKQDAALARRSATLQRGLPRPVTVNTGMAKGEGRAKDATQQLVQEELLLMLRHDAAKYPMSKADRKRKRTVPVLPVYDDELLAEARLLVQDALSDDVSPAALAQASESVQRTWEELYSTHAFLPTKKTYGFLDSVKPAEQIKALEQRFQLLREQLKQDNKNAAKMEKSCELLGGGFAKRAKTAHGAIKAAHEQLGQVSIELDCFTVLKQGEQVGLPNRLAWLKNEVNESAQQERGLQNMYQSLTQEKARLQALLKA